MIKNHLIFIQFKNERLTEILQAVPHFMIVLISYFNLIILSWIKKSLVLRNMEPLRKKEPHNLLLLLLLLSLVCFCDAVNHAIHRNVNVERIWEHCRILEKVIHAPYAQLGENNGCHIKHAIRDKRLVSGSLNYIFTCKYRYSNSIGLNYFAIHMIVKFCVLFIC